METRTIVVKNIEVGPGGRGGGTPSGGSGGNPLGGLGRFLLRVVLVVLAIAVAVPVVVLGGACLVGAVVAGILLWAVRRLLGRRGSPAVHVQAFTVGTPAAPPPADEGGRENVRVRN